MAREFSPLSTIRHAQIFNPIANDEGVTIVGAGAIGSRVYALLVELGLINITVIDFDVVESHNLANQLFSMDDLGKLKVDALRDWTQKKLGRLPPSLRFVNERANSETVFLPTTFLLVDSLEARRELAAILHQGTDCVRLIDARMGAAHGIVCAVSPHTDYAMYMSTLGGRDDEAEVSACGSPFSVAPTAALFASLAVWEFINLKTNPAASTKQINLWLKPFTTSNGQ